MKSELMKQLFDELIDSHEEISKVEHNFGRTLTDSEKIIVIEQGEQALLNKLGIDEADYNTMKRAFALISAGFTKRSEDYDFELEQENYKALDLFKSLVNDLEFVKEVKNKAKESIKGGKGTKISVHGEKEYESTYQEENDPELNDLFASETESKELGVTGDTYDEKADTECKEYFTKNEDPANEKTCNKQACTCKQPAWLVNTIESLDEGKEVLLDDECLQAIVNYLWNNRENVDIQIHNNKIRVK